MFMSRSSLLPVLSRIFMQILFLSKGRISLFASLTALLICLPFTAEAQDQFLTVTVQVNVTYAGNVPAQGAILDVTISDGVANTTQRRSMTTNSSGQFTISSTFKCSATDNSIVWGFGFRALLDDGYIQPMNGIGGGSHYCPNGNPPLEQFNPSLAGPAQNNHHNAGPTCNAVGEPVNVTNGNMFLQQNDYHLPGGVGENINITRTYNSMLPTSGSFGYGWKSDFDERVTLNCPPYANCDYATAILIAADGRRYYFRQTGTGNNGYYHFYSPITPGIYGQLVWYATTPSTYTINFKDGSVSQYTSSTGLLLWKKDRNGNQTTYTYNEYNRLIGVTDSFGRTLTITPNTNPYQPGTISQISDSLGVIASYTYEGAYPALLKTVTYSDGSKYKFDYQTINDRPYLTTVKDAVDNILETHIYDSQGRATTSEVQGGVEKYTLDYANANLDTNPYTTVTDGLGRVTKYYFDKSKGKNLVTKTEGVCSGCGGGSEVTNYEYNDRWNVVRKTDALLNETTYAYDNEENLLTQTDVFGTQKWTYDSFGKVLTYRDRIDAPNPDLNVNTAVLTYDANGNLKTVKDALNQITTVEYPATNNKGLPDSIKDARNNVTKFKWFPNSGLLDEIEDPYTKKTKFTYDARGRTKTITNALNHVTQYNYFDDTQRKVEMIYPNLDKITYKYDIRRLLENITDERGKISNYEFDSAYRLKKITDPLGHFREFDYDLMSNMKLYKDPLGNITDYKYDNFNRLNEIEYPAASIGATRLKEKFEYDQLGRIKKVTDTANRDTNYLYDLVNRTVTVTNAEGEATQTKYNQRFQTIEVKDALNQIYTFGYDPLGRVLSQTRAGGTMTFEYDEVGNRKKRTDYSGRVTNYTFDNLNRLKKAEYHNGDGNPTDKLKSEYFYDDISRLTSAVNEAGTVGFTYDNRNRTKTTTDVFGHLLEYEYERTSTVNQKRLKLDGAMYAVSSFDDAGRLSTLVNSSDSSMISFGYDNEDKITSRVFPNGVTTTYEYYNDDLLKRLKDVSTTATLFDRQYSYNSANQIDTITDLMQSRLFGYDLVDRLKTAHTNGMPTEFYNFNKVGNRTSSHLSSTYGYQTGKFNQLAATATATMQY